MRITEETFATIFELPVNCDLTLKHMTEEQAVKQYGPGGNGCAPRLTKQPGVLTWACLVTQNVVCDRGHSHGSRYFEGHGLTAAEAIENAAALMKLYGYHGQTTSQAL